MLNLHHHHYHHQDVLFPKTFNYFVLAKSTVVARVHCPGLMCAFTTLCLAQLGVNICWQSH